MNLCAAGQTKEKWFRLLMKKIKIISAKLKSSQHQLMGQLIFLFIYSFWKAHKVQNVFHLPTLQLHEDTWQAGKCDITPNENTIRNVHNNWALIKSYCNFHAVIFVKKLQKTIK